MSENLGDFSMLELFRAEAESQARVLNAGLLALEHTPTAPDQLEACMRAAHSLKGAARIVGQQAAVQVAHAMEDCFVAAQRREILLDRATIDLLLAGTDLLVRIGNTSEAEIGRWQTDRRGEIETVLHELAAARQRAPAPPPAARAEATASSRVPATAPPVAASPPETAADRVLRVTAENLNRLLALASESLVESRWLRPYAESLLRLKRLHDELVRSAERLRELQPAGVDERTAVLHADVHRLALECRSGIAARLGELDGFDRRSVNLAHRLYDEALAVRMRPFADAAHAFPRMVRDLARELGKEVTFQVIGESTPVDRDLLEQLEAPLTHLLRNALDHGIETPAERQLAGKPPAGRIQLEARHSAGLLLVSVSDDGHGIPLESLRQAVVARGLTTSDTLAQLSETELLDFLFLPGFSLKNSVTEISGRGVGLDVVQNLLKRVRGSVRVFTQPGNGARFQLQLPLTLSVMRALLVDIAGEPYAFPLAYIARTVKLARDELRLLEGRQHFTFEDRQIGLVSAHQVLEKPEPATAPERLPVVLIGTGAHTYGLVVDELLGERELVVMPLDGRLGKIKDILAATLTEDGSPALIVDVDDLTRSIEKLIPGGGLNRFRALRAEAPAPRKRILVVDDSLTVRELERKLLGHRGYEVEIAVDGMDGWNAVRTGNFSLVITDIDMPRLDGFELVALIKKDPHLKQLPVMIVSYKDREEDRRRGLEAGADYYLTKGSFHDETLLQAVVDLIGEPLP